MSDATIYHNPLCSKSRDSLALLKEKGYDPSVIEYLSDTPSKDRLKEIIKMMDGNARSILRSKESLWQNTYKDQNPNDETLLDIMIANPILIERPIVIVGNKAAIGRPAENILPILQ